MGPPRGALVLHGKLGSLDRGLGIPVRALDGARPSSLLPVLAYAGFARHVLKPSSRSLTMDVIGHSWSPMARAMLDSLFQPMLSAHEPENVTGDTALCSRLAVQLEGWAAPPKINMGQCIRTRSHLQGILRALHLKLRAEREGDFTYEWVLLSRWDIAWFRALDLGSFQLPPGHVLLPHQCAPLQATASFSAAADASLRAACGGEHSELMASSGAAQCGEQTMYCGTRDLQREARGWMVLDWWVAATSGTIDRFGELGTDAMFLNHSMLSLARFGRHGRSMSLSGHMHFGVHLMHTMGATLQFVGHREEDFKLARHWTRPDCAAPSPLISSVRGDPDGLVLQLSPQQNWLPLTFETNQTALRHACAPGFYACASPSERCALFDRAREPMDRTALRALFIACSDYQCTGAGHPVDPSGVTPSQAGHGIGAHAGWRPLSSLSAGEAHQPWLTSYHGIAHEMPHSASAQRRCAGELLGLWARLWRQARPANQTALVELADPMELLPAQPLKAKRRPSTGTGARGWALHRALEAGAASKAADERAGEIHAWERAHAEQHVHASERRARQAQAQRHAVGSHAVLESLEAQAASLVHPQPHTNPQPQPLGQTGTQMGCPLWTALFDPQWSAPRPLGLGYCGPTQDGESDCVAGSQGSWRLAAAGEQRSLASFLRACVGRCRRCSRCRYVSASQAKESCDWFASCNTDELGLDFGGETYLTLHVPHVPHVPRVPRGDGAAAAATKSIPWSYHGAS